MQKKLLLIFIIFLIAGAGFGQGTTINNLENHHIRDIGFVGRPIPDDLRRISYFEYDFDLLNFVVDNSELVSFKEEFETNGIIVIKYSLVYTSHNSIPYEVRMMYIEIFDSFFNLFGINPSRMNINEEENYRYINAEIRTEETVPIVIKLIERDYGLFSQQKIEVSIR